ncbi:hypothetical protein [Butyrivibrio sp. VCB2006]|uniref:hypothetical protein n=1 Tax=Butyrivibrio sp. VCB2006 TaxID=1280679 RepID=UPI000413CBC5|nr:hypothetical protein [Butyrivibrio sp. VCB2006]
METQYEQKMGWYKFIIFVQLPLAIVISAMMGLTSITIDGGFDILENFTAIEYLLMAVLAFCVHYELRKKMSFAPKLLLIFNAVTVLSSIVTAVINIRAGIDASSLFSAIAAGIILLIINYVYFDHRNFMFTEDDNMYKTIGLILSAVIVVLYLAEAFVTFRYTKTAADFSADDTLTASESESKETDSFADILGESSASEEATEDMSVDIGPLVFDQYVTEYEAFEIDGEYFTSNALGIKFVLPSTMVYSSNESIADMDGADSEDFLTSLSDDVNDGVIRTEMCAEATDDLSLGEVIVRVKYYGIDDDTLLDGVDMKQYINKAALKKEWDADDVTIETMDGEFCGKPYKGVLVDLNFEGFHIYEKQYVFIYKGYVGYVITYGESVEECDEYLSLFTSID